MAYYYNRALPDWRDHVCGLFYILPVQYGSPQKKYLPPVDIQCQSTILSTTSRTVLTQTFVNPSEAKGIKETRYKFPLYEGSSVVGFTCHVDNRTIVGEVKEKDKAKAVFNEAVKRGETAGLLEQLPDASDVFTTTVGNIPPGAKVIIKITYLGELRHDMEVDGIRFIIPTVICPRYGSYPGDLLKSSATDAMGRSISITVDAEMADGSFIQKMQSPSHPVSISMGTTSLAPNDDPNMSKASATLTLGSAELDTDFILQVVAKHTSVPKAILETHPTLPNQRALMTTLVPKFVLPGEKPEVVFVVDRSGSMIGNNMTLVKQALKVFLKSLPVGVKFNICSFGSHYSFLWTRSVTYSQQTLNEAVKHAETMDANYDGTEMLEPLEATINQRYKDMPLEVMMLTDGEIMNQNNLFKYLNTSIIETKAPIRIFTLGIGNGVSHALIEGIAKAGNGFAQTVGDGEKIDTKVVRMLKGALSPHVDDYTLEVKYSNRGTNEDDEDEFEIIDKVSDSLKLDLIFDEKLGMKEKTVGYKSQAIIAFFTDAEQQKKISLFDTSADPDKEEPPAYDDSGEAKYAHLPKVPVPHIIQAPQQIPPLFAFNRTTVFLLLGPDAPKATPTSVILRGTSAHGDLELDIPVEVLDRPGKTIHQLAAKKAIQELEQGRGWLSESKLESGVSLKSEFEGRYVDFVEREAVRLGIDFQVAGEWCSFVAVETNRKNQLGEDKEPQSQEYEWLEDEIPKNPKPLFGIRPTELEESGHSSKSKGTMFFGSNSLSRSRSSQQNQQLDRSAPLSGASNQFYTFANRQPPKVYGMICDDSNIDPELFGSNSPTSGLFGSTSSAPTAALSTVAASYTRPMSRQAPQQQQQPQQMTDDFFGVQYLAIPADGKLAAATVAPASFGAPISISYCMPPHERSASGSYGAPMLNQAVTSLSVAAGIEFDGEMEVDEYSQADMTHTTVESVSSTRSRRSALAPAPKIDTPEDLLHYLIGLQTFEGFWETSNVLLVVLQVNQTKFSSAVAAGVSEKHLATALAILAFEEKLASFKGSWELIVDKARDYLEMETGDVERLIGEARKVM